MFEHRRAPLAPRGVFVRRLVWHGLIAAGVVGVSLAIGAVGYRVSEGMSWLEATLNAAMILGGMGPVDQLQTTGGKVFAICYALYSGVAFLAIVAVMMGPVVHRFLHRFHLESKDKNR
jgi:hypothetical protein